MSQASSAPSLEPVELVELVDASSALTATFVPGAGMIATSLRDGDAELLGQRRGLEAYVEAGKTMGIPLLHPWANRLDGMTYEAAGHAVELAEDARGVRLDPNGLPIHGLLAAASGWQVEERTTSLLRAAFAFDDAELLRSFPFPHELTIEATLKGGRLRISTTVRPTGEASVPLAFGFHPYLTLPGVPREEWLVTLPAMRHRPVDDRGLPTGAAEPAPAAHFALGDRTYDDGYDELADGAAFVLEGGGRRITTTFESGYPAGQVFAPPGDALICFEPMAAPTNALQSGDGLRLVEPGDASTSTFSIAVSPGT